MFYFNLCFKFRKFAKLKEKNEKTKATIKARDEKLKASMMHKII